MKYSTFSLSHGCHRRLRFLISVCNKINRIKTENETDYLKTTKEMENSLTKKQKEMDKPWGEIGIGPQGLCNGGSIQGLIPSTLYQRSYILEILKRDREKKREKV